mmetsp:Transcript_24907/g.40556  ORF Transcript_24907/g.40556 Transcript_24907/m.40556 type:complete len:254 (+) Transcript_24907:234-995(+)|eukprot:CAMPEP_0196140102 /NCGR_PEP_ID=MMETSP0910-20130528/7131_1 /TAXON_ID=49265 /ORGANISM="Thalassiosira rotula, Strain GSO102" /LENGTH=253 /DNA_ID=CAMNT_0041400919 /DNA_START=253 /DNA_END=1014 /DNA_ORIENTATION=+
MAIIQDDFDASGSTKDSVFDWGNSREGSKGSRGGSSRSSSNNDDSSIGKNSIGSATTGPSSRYDPSAMSRIVDITDLVDDDDDVDSDDDDNVIPHASNISARNQLRKSKSRRKSSSPYLYMMFIVGVIIAASVAIGYAVMISDNPNDSSGGGGGAPPSKLGEGSESNVARQQQAGEGQQELLEIAENVIEACSEANLDKDMAECQSLCHASMCCFEEEGSDYGCEDEDDVDCAVYGGCEALLVGLIEDGEEEE